MSGFPVTLGRGVVEFRADDVQYQQRVKAVIDSAQRVRQRLEQAGAVAQKFLLAGTASVGVVLKLAADQENAERRVAAALEATGQAGLARVEALKAEASALQEVSRFGDENILQLQALAINLGASAEQATEMVKKSIGLANVLGQDLSPQMVRMVVLAEKGETTMLRRYIPALRSAKNEAEAMAIVQKVLAKGFAQEAALAATTSGRIVQLKNAIGDAGEEIGKALSPEILKLVDHLKEGVPQFIEWVRQNQDAIAANTLLAAKVLLVVAALPKLISLLAAVRVVMLAATASAVSLASAVGLVFALHILQQIAQQEAAIKRYERALRDSVKAANELATARHAFEGASTESGRLQATLDGLTAINREIVRNEQTIADIKGREINQEDDAFNRTQIENLELQNRKLEERRERLKALAEELRVAAAEEKAANEAAAQQAEEQLQIKEEQLEIEKQIAVEAEERAKQEEKARQSQERLQKGREAFMRSLALIGVSGEDRERISLEQRRAEFLQRAKDLGASQSLIDDINRRFDAEEAARTSGDSGGAVQVAAARAGSIVGPRQVFDMIQRAALTPSDPARQTAKNTKDMKNKMDSVGDQLEMIQVTLSQSQNRPAGVFS